MRWFLLVALVLSIVVSLSAQKKKEQKRELPDQVLAAQYVYVTGWHGDLYDVRTPPEERTAIMRVQTAVRDWGRYHLVFNRSEADMMLVVKPGHLGLVRGGVGVGGPPDIAVGAPQPNGRASGSIGTGVGYGGEGGSPGDYLMVSMYPNENPVDATYIWKRSESNGFEGRKIPLLEDFKKAVADSDKAKAASAKP